jgi:titin
MSFFHSFRGEAKPRKRSLSARLLLQPLEDRTVPSTFTVTTTHDSGNGSLRQAILNSNATSGVGGPNMITFNLPAGSDLIEPNSPLPTITKPVDIEASASNPVVLVGNGKTNENGLTIDANGCTISNLDIGGWLGDGILINSSNNFIEGNSIGMLGGPDPNGTGIVITGNSNTIGGTAAADANVIVLNDYSGIVIDNGQGNQVEGNFIGNGIPGFTNGNIIYGESEGNGLDGVKIEGPAAQNNIIGGTAAGALNVISGNAQDGVAIITDATSNTVEGNDIGTNSGGTAVGKDMGNGGDGIYIGSGAHGNFIGGTTTGVEGRTIGVGNVISGNGQYGVEISDAGTELNVLISNLIGTNSTGTAALPNGDAGVLIHNGASNNLVGTVQPVGGNVVSGNSKQGVVISGAGTTDNLLLNDYIGTNWGGTAALTNGSHGVLVEAGAVGNFVGIPGCPNVISGNTKAAGVYILGAGTKGNSVEANMIGVDEAGTAKLGNYVGIVIAQGASNNTIGGSAAGAGNIISGNAQQGVLITNAGTKGNLLEGNLIGTELTSAVIIANAFSGVTIDAGAASNTVGGPVTRDANIISGNGGNGVYITGAGSNKNTVADNFIGTNLSGTGALPNSLVGVSIAAGASKNTVGDGNTISGNTEEGVLITGMGTSGNVVEGNRIGTNVAGTAAVGNGFSGIAIEDGATGNTVGGTSTGAGNTISGNGDDGVNIAGTGTENNTVEENLIGTNSAGTSAVPNGDYGVIVSAGASNDTIGEGNVVSGNTLDGIIITGKGTTGITVANNLIGLNATENGAIPNGTNGLTIAAGAFSNGVYANLISGNMGDGIHLSDTDDNGIQRNGIGFLADGVTPLPNATGIVIDAGASENVIGGPSGYGNVIGGNTGAGIAILGTKSTGNTISQNSIYDNGGLGIDLGNTGTPTPNAPGGFHSGPNDLLNFPVLTASTTAGFVNISLNSTPNTGFTIELFSSSTSSPGQGETYLGTVSLMTNTFGLASTTYFFAPTGPNIYLTATATDTTYENTSEFSAPFTHAG